MRPGAPSGCEASVEGSITPSSAVSGAGRGIVELQIFLKKRLFAERIAVFFVVLLNFFFGNLVQDRLCEGLNVEFDELISVLIANAEAGFWAARERITVFVFFEELRKLLGRGVGNVLKVFVDRNGDDFRVHLALQSVVIVPKSQRRHRRGAALHEGPHIHGQQFTAQQCQQLGVGCRLAGQIAPDRAELARLQLSTGQTHEVIQDGLIGHHEPQVFGFAGKHGQFEQRFVAGVDGNEGNLWSPLELLGLRHRDLLECQDGTSGNAKLFKIALREITFVPSDDQVLGAARTAGIHVAARK